jgi:hypothetical protein
VLVDSNTSVTASSVVVSVSVLVRVEVDAQPARVVTVDWTTTVDVGRSAAVVVAVLVGTLATDLVPKTVRQLTVGLWARAEVARSGRTARIWMMLFMVEDESLEIGVDDWDEDGDGEEGW